jgi:apolipoprotein N-acyltransferase
MDGRTGVPPLVVWPESALPLLLAEEDQLRARIFSCYQKARCCSPVACIAPHKLTYGTHLQQPHGAG